MVEAVLPWDAMAYDPELNLLYIGTGNGAPWNRDIRSPGGGDNLYLSSIVALDPDNGDLKWYYQTTPGDTWDYTATQHIILADLEIEESTRNVIMQAPKNGFFYLLDRTDGSLISAEPYVYTNWAKKIDTKTGRPIETAYARYPDANVQIAPSAGGGHNWQPMAYNRKTGLLYIPARENGMWYGQPGTWQYQDDSRTWNTATGWVEENQTIEDSLADQNHGKLIAWDPVKQKEVWSVWQQSSWNAGVLTTDDLVFQGNAEGEFVAFDASTGTKLWSTQLNTGIIGSPITYEVDGSQYVSILVGWGGVMGLWSKETEQINPGTLYTFSLDGEAEMPSYTKVPIKEIIDLPFQATDVQIAQGQKLFDRYCSQCHKDWGGGSIPDLTYSSPEMYNSFQQIVGQGILLPLGMPNFGDRLLEKDIENIKSYLLDLASTKRESD